ncbi:MAG: hypothetical protein ABI435_06095 [Pseudolysinimonas sp.]
MSEPLPSTGWRTGELDFSAFSVPDQPVEAKEVAASFWPTIPDGAPLFDFQVWVDWIMTIGGYLSSAIMLLIWLPVVVTLAVSTRSPFSSFGQEVMLVLTLGALFWVLVAASIWGTFRLRRVPNRSPLWWRLLRFARANGLSYQPWTGISGGVTYPPTPGISGSTTSLVRGNTRFWFEDCFRPLDSPDDLTVATLVIGGYSANFNAGERKWGFVELRLGRSLPHIVVETTERGRAISDYGMLASQGFELEGDFPHYARVYADEANRATALELLTPDVMAAIVDETAGFDLEVRGDRLSMTSPTMNDLAYPATLARLFRIGAVIGTEARAVSTRRGDERYGVEAVAAATPPRMRQRRIPRGAIRGFIISAIAIFGPAIVLLVIGGLRAS